MSAAAFALRADRRILARADAAMPRLWLQRIRIRRELARLHPEQLREVGLDLTTVRAEMLKPFWRA